MKPLTIDTIEQIARAADKSANDERQQAGLPFIHISPFVARHVLAAAIAAGVVVMPEESEANNNVA